MSMQNVFGLGEFYEQTDSEKIHGYGCTIPVLDAFAYLHKQVGESNFFSQTRHLGIWNV
jgi:hypothetical protein